MQSNPPLSSDLTKQMLIMHIDHCFEHYGDFYLFCGYGFYVCCILYVTESGDFWVLYDVGWNSLPSRALDFC